MEDSQQLTQQQYESKTEYQPIFDVGTLAQMSHGEIEQYIEKASSEIEIIRQALGQNVQSKITPSADVQQSRYNNPVDRALSSQIINTSTVITLLTCLSCVTVIGFLVSRIPDNNRENELMAQLALEASKKSNVCVLSFNCPSNEPVSAFQSSSFDTIEDSPVDENNWVDYWDKRLSESDNPERVISQITRLYKSDAGIEYCNSNAEKCRAFFQLTNQE